MRALFVYRASPFSDQGFDLVLTVGGDGTFLDAAQSVTRAPLLGLNSSPLDSVGLFCGAAVETLPRILDAIAGDRLPPVELTRLGLSVGGRALPIRALNDILLTHANPGATSKFILDRRGKREDFKSSGIWVAPAAGSTAAIASAGGTVLPLGSRGFQFVVREAYIPDGRRHRMTRGVLGPGETLVLHSKMRSGRIYVDGPHREFPFPLGAKAVISAKVPTLRVFALDRKRRERFAR
jgi:NAD+ kinase